MKNKQLIGIGICGVALLVGGAGFLVWQAQQRHEVASSDLYGGASNYTSAQTDPAASAAAQGQTQTISSSVPASSTQPDGTSSSQSLTQISGNASTAASASANKLLDPTTFAQYDKYKTATTAQYIDLDVGTGATLAAGQKAAVYYKGWLTNGTLFDQSQKGSDGNLQAFTFTLGQHQVIDGWEQGLAGMKVGGVRLLIVPPSAGYGATGQGPIPGNAVLIFQVQLAATQ